MRFFSFFRRNKSGESPSEVDGQDTPDPMENEAKSPTRRQEVSLVTIPGWLTHNDHILTRRAEFRSPDDLHFVENTVGANTVAINILKNLRETENVRSKLDEYGAEILREIANVAENVGNLSDLVKKIPKDTVDHIQSIKRYQPLMYEKLAQTIGNKVRAAVTDMIDANIVKIIKEDGNISSLSLLERVQQKRICSKNTLYRHLKNLEAKGILVKRRQGHKVLYSTPNILTTPNVEES